ncbi:MAG: CPBP family intramembrane glutamic endopeptidase [Phototrophicaceae bacterium]|jgi:membrane protease YdiL (CAAX protease family)
MFFYWKRALGSTYILTFALFVGAIVAQQAIGIPWVLRLRSAEESGLPLSDLWIIILASVLLLVVDGITQGVIRGFYGSKFQETQNLFLDNVAVGNYNVVWIVGVTAAMEELFFRGVIVQGMQHVGTGVIWAVIVGAFFSGLAHYFDDRPGYRWWALTNTSEGIFLAILQVLTGSILVVMIVHFIHDTLYGSVGIFLHRNLKASQGVTHN